MKKHRILLVEDEGIIAADLKCILQRTGYDVVGIAASAEEAIASAEQLRPDLVLMDIMLQTGMDGVAAAAEIRRHFSLPVIFLSAHSDTSTFDRAKLTEPYGYIVKPVNERDLKIGIEMGLYKHAMERRLAESEQWFSTTLSSIGDAVIATDAAGLIQFLNPLARVITGWDGNEALGRSLSDVLALTDGAEQPGKDPFTRVKERGGFIEWTSQTWLRSKSGGRTPVDYTAAPIRHPDGTLTGVVVVFRDITARQQAEEERERLISELQESLAKVKQLSGLIPICASCKKIREDRNYWTAVEAYVASHSEAKFSHTVCPDCLRKLYPDFAEEILSEMATRENQS